MKGKKKEEVDFATLPKANMIAASLILDFKNPNKKFKILEAFYKNGTSDNSSVHFITREHIIEYAKGAGIYIDPTDTKKPAKDKDAVPVEKKEISDDEPHIKDTNIALYSKRGFNGNIIILPKHTSYNFITLLIDLIDATGPYDAIIELGCGYGRNLFEIFYGGGPREAKYIGGEFTKSGVEIAQKLAKKAPKMKTEFFHFNHLEPKLPFKKPFKRAFVFTCHSIEQVMQINENWFDEVVKAGEFVRGAHLEPFGFQLKNSGPLSDMHKDFMIQNSWNINFAEVLRQAVERKIVKDEQIFLEMGVTPDINVGSLAVWSKA